MQVISAVELISLREGRFWPMEQIGFIATLIPTSLKILLIFSAVPWMYESDVNLVNEGNSPRDQGLGEMHLQG